MTLNSEPAGGQTDAGTAGAEQFGYIRKTANELYVSVFLRVIPLYDHAEKIKYLAYAGTAIRNATMDFNSTAFAAFEQRIQSDQDGIRMEFINLDDFSPARIPCSGRI